MKICCYNVQLRPWQFKFYNNFLEYVEQFDIICLQEAFYNINPFQGKRRIVNLLKQKNYHVVYSKLPNFLLGEHLTDAGLIIASKYPILNHTFFPYFDHCNVDSLAEKGFIHCEIITHSGPFHLINTHLQACYPDINSCIYSINTKERTKQLMQLYALLIHLKGDIVIAGDFNISTPQEAILFDTMCKKLKVSCNNQKEDCILSNKKTEPFHEKKEKVLQWSDHEPLAVKIAL